MIALALAVGGASCTGEDEPPSGSTTSPTPSGEAPVASDAGDVVFVPGEFSYDFNDIKATLSMDGSDATLDVANRSGGELGKPGMYVIAGDGKRYEGTVASSATIADGGEASFQVTFPEQVTPDTVGLAILLFGGSNAGAMAPVPEA
jgi:hypothetical protein